MEIEKAIAERKIEFQNAVVEYQMEANTSDMIITGTFSANRRHVKGTDYLYWRDNWNEKFTRIWLPSSNICI